MTTYDNTLAALVAERNSMVNRIPAMNLEASEEGHVFDHEPGMTDYHHDYVRVPDVPAHYHTHYAEPRKETIPVYNFNLKEVDEKSNYAP